MRSADYKSANGVKEKHVDEEAHKPTLACRIVVHLCSTIHPFDLKYLIKGPA